MLYDYINNVMDNLVKFIFDKSNYSLQNRINLYNFCVDVIQINNDEEYKKKILKLIKKNIGLSFYNELIQYCIRKDLDINFK